MIGARVFLFSFFERYDRSTPDGLGAFCIPMRGEEAILAFLLFSR